MWWAVELSATIWTASRTKNSNKAEILPQKHSKIKREAVGKAGAGHEADSCDLIMNMLHFFTALQDAINHGIKCHQTVCTDEG